jgi:hypothetical protein
MIENQIKFTEDSTVKLSKRSDIFGVENKDWSRIKDLIEELSVKSSRWENLAWFFSATTIFLFISYCSVEDTNKFRLGFLWAGAFSLILTFFLFVMDNSLSKNFQKEKKRILKEMEKMEVQQERDTQEGL